MRFRRASIPVARDRWCTAPWSGILFNTDGSVRPCCASSYVLGYVTGPARQGLREIWEGYAAEQLREAMAREDLSLGCQHCGKEAAAAGRSASLAVAFDPYQGTDGRWPKRIEFTMSNRCNLACVMCHGDLSSTIRANREHRPPLPAAYDDAFFAELAEFLPHAEAITFKGGEPFLAPEVKRVMEALIDIGFQGDVSVTTNGTVWTPHVERALRELRIYPVVSIDAVDPALLADIRVGVDPDKLWSNLDRIQAVAASVGRGTGLSYSLMASNWQELAPLLAVADARGLGFDVNFVTGPDPDHVIGLGVPADEVITGMEAQAPTLELHDPALRREWDFALGWVRWVATQRAERPVDETAEPPTEPLGVPVSIASSRPIPVPEPTDAAHAEALAGGLRALADGDLLWWRSIDNVVLAADVPAWAAPWFSDDVEGWSSQAMIDALCAGLDARHSVEPGDDHRSAQLLFTAHGRVIARGHWTRIDGEDHGSIGLLARP